MVVVVCILNHAPYSSAGSIQSLLNAASLLEDKVSSDKQYSGVWNSKNSPWCDDYDNLEETTPTDNAQIMLSNILTQLKSETVVYSSKDYQNGLFILVQYNYITTIYV